MVRCRPPAGIDLEKAARAGLDAARDLIVDCVLELTAPDGQELPADKLPRELEPDVAQVLAGFDPAAECDIPIECPSCNCTIEAVLDSYTLLRAGLGSRVQIYDDVYRIARVYHWSEADILSLPAPRRRQYLAAAGKEAHQ